MNAVDVMTQTNKVQEIAAEIGMSFNQFAARCLLRDLSYDTAVRVWNDEKQTRGFNAGTKLIISKVLRRPIDEVFPED
jgi:hypothetical protein